MSASERVVNGKTPLSTIVDASVQVAAKKYAIAHDIPLRVVVTEALREFLARREEMPDLSFLAIRKRGRGALSKKELNQRTLEVKRARKRRGRPLSLAGESPAGRVDRAVVGPQGVGPMREREAMPTGKSFEVDEHATEKVPAGHLRHASREKRVVQQDALFPSVQLP